MTDYQLAARAHQKAIDALWDFDDPAESERRFADAVREAAGLERYVLLTQLARALGLQERSDEALAVLNELPDDEDEELRVRTLLERGRILNSSGDPDGAWPEFEASLGAAMDSGFDQLAVDALHMMAIVAAPSDQDSLNQRALDLAESSDDARARGWRGSLLNNMGWTAFDRGDFDEALSRFEAALQAMQERGKEQDILIARWCIARCLREMGRPAEALTILLELRAAHDAAGSAGPFVDEEIAACRAALAASDQS